MSARNLKMKPALCLVAAPLSVALCDSARAGVVTDWNPKAQQTLLRAKFSALTSTRALAMVQVAVFDAVNGIGRRYTPVQTAFDAPSGASRRAAAGQADYAALVQLVPAQRDALGAERDAALASIFTGEAGQELKFCKLIQVE